MEAVRRIVHEIRQRVHTSGFRILEDKERTLGYLNRHFPQDDRAVEACIEVLYLEHYLDALIWLEHEPQTQRLRETYRDYFERLIGAGRYAASITPIMLEANELLLAE